jgi:hypothetical protein
MCNSHNDAFCIYRSKRRVGQKAEFTAQVKHLLMVETMAERAKARKEMKKRKAAAAARRAAGAKRRADAAAAAAKAAAAAAADDSSSGSSSSSGDSGSVQRYTPGEKEKKKTKKEKKKTKKEKESDNATGAVAGVDDIAAAMYRTIMPIVHRALGVAGMTGVMASMSTMEAAAGDVEKNDDDDDDDSSSLRMDRLRRARNSRGFSRSNSFADFSRDDDR